MGAVSSPLSIGHYVSLDKHFHFQTNQAGEIDVLVAKNTRDKVSTLPLAMESLRHAPAHWTSEEKVQWLLRNHCFTVMTQKQNEKKVVCFTFVPPESLSYKKIKDIPNDNHDKLLALSDGSLISYGSYQSRVAHYNLWNKQADRFLSIYSTTGTRYASCVELSRDHIALLTDKGIEVRLRHNGQLHSFLESESSDRGHLKRLSNGYLVSTTSGWTFCIWDWENRKLIHHFEEEWENIYELSNRDLLLFSPSKLQVFTSAFEPLSSGEYTPQNGEWIAKVVDQGDKQILLMAVPFKDESKTSNYQKFKSTYGFRIRQGQTISEMTILTEKNRVEEGCLAVLQDGSIIFVEVDEDKGREYSLKMWDASSKKVKSFHFNINYRDSISHLHLLANGTIACVIDSKRLLIFTKEDFQRPLFDKRLEISIRNIRELPDGCIGVQTWEAIQILCPHQHQQNKDLILEIAHLEAEIRHNPHDLSLYEKLAEKYKQQQEPNATTLYALYLQAIRIAGQSYQLYQARRFFKKADQLESKKQDHYHIYLALPLEAKERRRIYLKFNRIFKANAPTLIQKECSLALDALKNRRCKTRLFIGEGDFSYTKSLIAKHQETHPHLATSLIATDIEVSSEEALATIKILREKGVKIDFALDAQKIHEKFKGKRIKRIHWNCPYGKKPEEIVPALAKFFQSCSSVQLPKDRVHVTLAQEKDSKNFWRERQYRYYGIVPAATHAGYRLIRKRGFGKERYSDYEHTKTDGGKREDFLKREFVFEKIDSISSKETNIAELIQSFVKHTLHPHLTLSAEKGSEKSDESIPNLSLEQLLKDGVTIEKLAKQAANTRFLEKAESLCSPGTKSYTVREEGAGNYYFDCSTDEDSSDYYDSDSSEEGEWVDDRDISSYPSSSSSSRLIEESSKVEGGMEIDENAKSPSPTSSSSSSSTHQKPPAKRKKLDLDP